MQLPRCSVTDRACKRCGERGGKGACGFRFVRSGSGRHSYKGECRACENQRDRDRRAAKSAPTVKVGEHRPVAHAAQPDREPKHHDPVAAHEQREADRRERRQYEALIAEVRELRRRQAFLDKLDAHHAPPHIPRREHASGMREMTAVVLASDWHVEEEVDGASIAYRNEYDLTIAAERVDRFFRAIEWNVTHQRASGLIAIRDLILWLGGDLMSGYIHEELVETNQLSPTETILWLLPRLEGGIRYLLDSLGLDRIVIPCSYGNHGRTTDKSRISSGFANSFEWLMYRSLAMRFSDEPRIQFEITPSAHQYVKAYDYTLHFHHGDDVRYQGGVGGIGIPLLKAVAQWDKIVLSEIHHIGHWHTLRDFGRAVVNGSLIGYGPYSQRIRADFEHPQQAMYFLDRDRGKCMLTPLWVAEREDEAMP